jgi:hypothetical protein
MIINTPDHDHFRYCQLCDHAIAIILRLCQLCDHAIAIILFFLVLYKIDTPVLNIAVIIKLLLLLLLVLVLLIIIVTVTKKLFSIYKVLL